MAKSEQRKRLDKALENVPDRMYEAANEYVENLLTVEKIIGKFSRNRESELNSAFVDGWRAAMEIRYPELLDESTALHRRIIEGEIKKETI